MEKMRLSVPAAFGRSGLEAMSQDTAPRREPAALCMNLRSKGTSDLVPLVPDIRALERGISRQRRAQQDIDMDPPANGQGVNPQHPPRPARPIGTYDRPNINGHRLGIRAPAVEANNFEVKPGLLNVIENNKYHGLAVEDPFDHLDKGALPKYRSRLDTASNGFFLGRTEADAEELVDNMVKSDAVYSGDHDRGDRTDDKQTRKELKALQDKIDILIADKATQEQLNFVGNPAQEAPPGANEYNNYQQRSYPNNQQNGYQPRNNQQGNSQPQQNPPPGFPNKGNQSSQQQAHPSSSAPQASSTDILLKQILESQTRSEKHVGYELKNLHNKIDGSYNELNNKFKALENQFASLTTHQNRQQGSLPGKPEQNPKETMKAVTLRSGKQLPPPTLTKDAEKQGGGVAINIDDEVVIVDEKINDEILEKIVEAKGKGKVGEEKQTVKDGQAAAPATENPFVPPPYEPKLPFPGRFKKQLLEKYKALFEKQMSEVQITMPIIDAFMLVPQYSKFLKDAVAAKKKEMQGMMILTHECNAIIQRLDVPKKLEDPGCFTLPCALGPMVFERCLCDLGASVSLMPLSVAKKLGFTQYKKCRLSLVLADRSVKYPVGILEDLPLMVGNCEIPTDFVVLEMGEEAQDPLILGRPFLATAGAIVNVKEGKIDLHLGKRHVLHFDIKEVMKKPTVHGQIFYIEEMDALADELLEELSLEDPLQLALTVEKEAEVIENLESTAYGMMLDSHKGFESKDQYEELPQVVHQVASVTQQENTQQDDWSELKAPKVELKPLPHGVRYAFLGPNETYPVIVSSELTEPELAELLKTLKRFRKAIGYSLDDIKGISPTLCMHRIHLEDESMTSIEHQRRLNPNLKDVVKKEILKLLDAGVIYPISDSKWVSPVHVVPKKGGITVVKNDKDELIPTRTITGHRMCIDYRKLNSASRKDHFPLPFIDQMLERLANHPFYCFLDGYSGFFQIPIHPNDQEKTTFTCPYGTFAYRRMPFGLCNAPATFQRCMMSIFSDLIEDVVEVFMDDFSVYGSSFSACLSNLCRVLQRCEDTNLVLNWEKCHFMVKEGIVLGHKISEKGIEVDKAKIDVMVSLAPPKTVKDIRSFLGHAGFYRRFIQDFSRSP
ncbi:LOW QUALITY PROTEIN: uncharacterized protein LOC130501599, partial [Raphanus sativus]|uniref:LOW QUALITY PROTEIN: uncharacterized protein LOC130501599 n=1 Tax=Raphanus sativus TaxID=3726 RepID=A0A9W3CLF1_RAPSA